MKNIQSMITTKAPKGLSVLFILLLLAFSTQSSQAQAQKPVIKQEATASQELKQASIPVKGMTCNSCVANVKKKLKSMDGLHDVQVSLEQRKASLQYDPAKVTPQQVQEAINELGYTAGEPVSENK